MGKRKLSSRAKLVAKKPREKLDTSIECDVDMKNMIGEAFCSVCQESYSTTITCLTEPIDVYSEWIDECEWVYIIVANDRA
ncbi:hypothetical protein ACE6H2_007478 [Prunus campanulata]